MSSHTVGPVIRLAVETTFTAPGNEMVRIELLDKGAHLGNPLA
jgi:hypothetical protein